MNKKAQYMQPPMERAPFADVSPIMIVGVIIFVIPFFGPIVKWNMPGWISGAGIVIIFIGIIHTVGKRMIGN